MPKGKVKTPPGFLTSEPLANLLTSPSYLWDKGIILRYHEDEQGCQQRYEELLSFHPVFQIPEPNIVNSHNFSNLLSQSSLLCSHSQQLQSINTSHTRS